MKSALREALLRARADAGNDGWKTVERNEKGHWVPTLAAKLAATTPGKKMALTKHVMKKNAASAAKKAAKEAAGLPPDTTTVPAAGTSTVAGYTAMTLEQFVLTKGVDPEQAKTVDKVWIVANAVTGEAIATKMTEAEALATQAKLAENAPLAVPPPPAAPPPAPPPPPPTATVMGFQVMAYAKYIKEQGADPDEIQQAAKEGEFVVVDPIDGAILGKYQTPEEAIAKAKAVAADEKAAELPAADPDPDETAELAAAAAQPPPTAAELKALIPDPALQAEVAATAALPTLEQLEPAPTLAQLGPAPDLASVEATEPVSIAGWKQVGPQAGSNPGGLFEDPTTGKRYYVKLKDEAHARNELLAAKLYEAAGVKVPSMQVIEQGGVIGIASEIVEGKVGQGNLGAIPGVHEGFAADAWLANWDVVGMSSDNILVDKSGQALRIDLGGSLLYRAKGSPKGAAFGDKVGELDTLRDNYKNPSAASAFSGLSNADIQKGAARVSAISDDHIRAIVKQYGPKGVEGDGLADKLIARKASLAKQAKSLPEPPKPSVSIVDPSTPADPSPAPAVYTPPASSSPAPSHQPPAAIPTHAPDGTPYTKQQLAGFKAAASKKANALKKKLQATGQQPQHQAPAAPQQKGTTSAKGGTPNQPAPNIAVALGEPLSAEGVAAIKQCVQQQSTSLWKKAVGIAGSPDPQKAVDMVADWKGSSGSEGALELRGAAAYLLAEGGADAAKLLAHDFQGYKVVYNGSKATHDDYAGEKGKAAVTHLKAMAKVAQSQHADEWVTLYRGIKGSQAQLVKKALAQGAQELEVDVGLLASFSEAKHVSASSTFSGPSGVVLKVRVHRSAIVASHRAATGAVLIASEKEVIILSKGKIRIPVSDITPGGSHY